MESRTDIYQSPLGERYPSPEMLSLFSADKKFSTWRELWVALAIVEKELGTDISDSQIEEMRKYINQINYDVANKREEECRHDVMAHVYAFGVQCPEAAGIIHLGATSCYVTDNADLIIMRRGLQIIKKRLLGVIKLLSDFAKNTKDIVTLGYTHYQPAQLVTVGKRAVLWVQDFLENLEELEFVMSKLKFLGCKGTTGTQESFMKLYDGNEEKVRMIDEKIAEQFGFDEIYPIASQTYPRGLDARVVDCLSHIAISAGKFATDLRLLQHDKELEEPFEKNQIGSSAMGYKRNPMRSERIFSLSRHVLTQSNDAKMTAITQWLERTLDDSANRRMTISESFLTTDAILVTCANVSNGIVVYPGVIRKRIEAELPFMATEEVLMKAVQNGANRQVVHERIRIHSMSSTLRVKVDGLDNDLVQRLADDYLIGMTKEEILKTLVPENLCGRSSHQVTEFLDEYVEPVLQANAELIADINTEVKI
jgi:adenylosuccinate lyase